MTDLFTSHLSKRDRLKMWLKDKGYIPTSAIVAWGVDNYYPDRAARTAREFHEEGLLRRLTEQEKAFRGFGNSKEGVYEWVGEK